MAEWGTFKFYLLDRVPMFLFLLFKVLVMYLLVIKSWKSGKVPMESFPPTTISWHSWIVLDFLHLCTQKYKYISFPFSEKGRHCYILFSLFFFLNQQRILEGSPHWCIVCSLLLHNSLVVVCISVFYSWESGQPCVQGYLYKCDCWGEENRRLILGFRGQRLECFIVDPSILFDFPP